MAIVRAVKTGNWSDPTVWNTGALPTSADDVWANTFTVAADTTTTVLSIRNGSTTGVTAGGSFTAVNGVTLTLTGEGVVAAPVTCFISSLTTGQSCTIQGAVRGGTSSSAMGVNNLSSGTTYIIGSVTGGTTGGGGSLAIGVNNNSTGTVEITGSVTGGIAVSNGNNSGAYNASTGTLIITGDVVGGNAGTGTFGAFNSSTGTLIITGNVAGGATASGASNSSTGTLEITGSIIAFSLSGLSTGNISQNTFLTGPFIGTAQGVAANNALRWRWIPSVGPSYMTVPNSTATGYKNLYTADSTDSQSGQPATTNVRSGTIYGPNSELTGTCAVPAAGSVALGVQVGNTTGTAVLTEAAVRSAVGLASANLDAQFAAIPAAPSAAAIRTEMDSNSTKLANLDATVSSRLATSGYTAPPSVGDIATAVWAAATRTLTTAIDNSSTIAAAVWSAVSRTITGGTVDTLTNAPSVPSAATIASSVRTELSTELGRIDANVSSRLAPGGTLARVTLADTVTTLTNAPDVPTEAEIADAVRAELTPELARLSNAATTQEVGDIVEGALSD